MIISGQKVKARGLITDAQDECFTKVGYDFTVGEIYVPRDGDGVVGKIVEEYEVPAQGVVVLFSRECITMPEDICGMAMPKTALCDDGILVFNTGVVDPGYKGKLSGTTVNFRKTPFTIRKGQRFLRVMFEKVIPAKPNEEVVAPPQAIPQQEYETYRDRKVLRAQEFSHTFLNIPATVALVSEKVVKKEKDNLLWLIGVIAVLFAIIQIVTAFSPNAIEWYRTTGINSQIEAQQREIKTLTGDLKAAKQAAEKRANALEDELQQLRQAPTLAPKSP